MACCANFKQKGSAGNSHTYSRFSTTPNSLWMKPTLLRTLQTGTSYCSLLLVLRGADSEYDLSKYVFVCIKTASKLQNIFDNNKFLFQKVTNQTTLFCFLTKKVRTAKRFGERYLEDITSIHRLSSTSNWLLFLWPFVDYVSCKLQSRWSSSEISLILRFSSSYAP